MIKYILHSIRKVDFLVFLKSFLSTLAIVSSIASISFVLKTTFFSVGEKPEHLSKIEELNNISKSLEDLSKYLENQKKAIIDYENSVNQLRKEKSELEPIVESNRQLVENLFIEHDKRVNKNIWTERIVSFILGVLSSIIATISYEFFKKRQLKKSQFMSSDTGKNI